jgi:hypothetical protein
MNKRIQADSPWKEALERYFPHFMAFFFPIAHATIDWQRDWTFLDKELEQIVRDAELGRRLVDKLVQVWVLMGKKTGYFYRWKSRENANLISQSACIPTIIGLAIATIDLWPALPY